jgi:transcriptional regulator with XRE-family HTH domain/tetratricopeptide (TPR) repeat protein
MFFGHSFPVSAEPDPDNQPAQPGLFGTELRRLRGEAGLSLADLAALVHYSKGYLSKIENGLKTPPFDLGLRCDAALGTKETLTRLAPPRPSAAPLSEAADGGDVWLMNLAPGGKSWFRTLNRRDILVTGAASMIGGKSLVSAASERSTLDAFTAMFGQLRQLGQTTSPGVVLPSLIAQTHTLRELAAYAESGAQRRLLVLGARYAEYAGWMAQEAGDDQAALWWTGHAVEMAKAGGDEDLAAYSLVRRALITFYRGDPVQTVALAQQAQEQAVPGRIRGLAAQREAQGHALAGDYDQCFRSLDRARDLLAAHPAEPGSPVLGPTNLADPAAMARGWCLHDLGRPLEAAHALDLQLSMLPARAMRSHARYGVRRALAYAAANEIEHACDLLTPLLGVVDLVASATVQNDLRKVAKSLSRFHAHPRVRDVYPSLTSSLRSPAL